ncbi:MAG: hypothetical protein ACM3ZV_03770 [Bacillota bacterium]
MSGYRQHSFDPYAGGDYGPPLRPYNWVQWTGAGFGVAGAALSVYYFLGEAGAVPKILDSVLPASAMVLLGAALINSRRQPIAPEQAARQRRRALIVAAVAIAAFAIGFAAVIYFKGA